MSPVQTLHPCNQLDFSLPWAEPPVVSGWNSKVKWVLPATQTDPQRPQGDNKSKSMGIVLGETDLASLASES